MDKIEQRSILAVVKMEQRSSGETPVFKGLPIVFNSRSEDLGDFVEEIDPGAMEGVKVSDCIACFEHDRKLLLGSVGGGTLRLKTEERGVACEIDPCDTTISRDCRIHVARGDVRYMSYKFIVAEERWNFDAAKPVRRIMRFEEILDVTLTTTPAYKDTKVAMRSMEKGKPVTDTSVPTVTENLDFYKRKHSLHSK